MSSRLPSIALSAVLVFVLITGWRPFRAETQAQNPDVLPALLAEVKGLRAAMEQLASSGPRVQLAFGRLQMHEQRISGMVRRLDAVRERIAPAMKEEEQLRNKVTFFQDVLNRTSGDPSRAEERKQFEAEWPALKRLADRAALDLQQLQAEETALATDIAAEQGRWVLINQQLEELERALIRR